MNKFEGIQFQGTFRSYQQRVLDNVEQYLADGKVNIVAAPGSGKTVLGLELIRKLGQPCLILSPTTAIREQWGQRFRELFLEDESRFEELFSTDLHEMKLVNSITYQALYEAILGIDIFEDGQVKRRAISVRRTLRKYKIKTICLNEAHYLKDEWQWALKKLMEFLEEDVKIISLTATLPYDSEGVEWKRYYDLCGEIDEEILVPELVAQRHLCPHQDYVYFNYPTQKETAALREYEEHVRIALEEVGQLECIRTLIRELSNWSYFSSYIGRYPYESVPLLVLLKHYGLSINPHWLKRLTGKKDLPKPELFYFQTALQQLVDNKVLYLSENQREKIILVLRKNQVFNKEKVYLVWNESLRKALISSAGKLESISSIAGHEYQTMGKALRMLVLTDDICNDRENISKIGTGEVFHSVNEVSIFETLRRRDNTLNIGVLSGSLVILPQSIELQGIMVTKEPIPGTCYCILDMFGSTHEAVDFVSQLFREGKLQILIGAKELLGEDWDESCINSLILANFEGSYMFCNQMRGRAIRMDKDNPEKITNIWHLVTLEPGDVVTETALERLAATTKEPRTYLQSWDFEVVKRRFDFFMAPNYETGEIESGISRITLIRSPFDANGIDRINQEMLELSADREAIRKMWKEYMKSKKFGIVVEAAIPQERTVSPFSYKNSIGVYVMIPVYVCVMVLFSNKLIQAISMGENVSRAVIFFLCWLIFGVMLFQSVGKVTNRLLRHRTSVHSLKTMGEALVNTLTECGFISPGVEVYVEKGGFFKKKIAIQLRNATMHDQNTFNRAISEMLSPIEDPRFLLIREKSRHRCDYSVAIACPTVLGGKRKYAEVLARHLEKSLGKMDVAKSRKEYLFVQKCRRSSFVMRGGALNSDTSLPGFNRKYIVTHEEESS